MSKTGAKDDATTPATAASAVAPGLFAFDDDQAHRLAKQHGTPMFAYHAPTARRCYRRLRKALPDRVRIAYAVKSNPHPRLLGTLAELGASFDCASEGELRRVGELQLPRGRVFFAGPGKRSEELRLALDVGARVQAEGWEDLQRLDRQASGPLAVNLRVHPSRGVEEDRHILGGVGPSAFGVDEEDLERVLARAARLERVVIRGVHVFAATNQRDVDRLLTTYRMVFDIARRVVEHGSTMGVGLEQIDVGGGLGIAYGADEAGLDVAALGAGLEEILADEPWFEGEVIIEPGRLLSGPCGMYLARVVRVKHSRGVRFAILEGGINHLMRPFLTGQPFPVRAVGKSPVVATNQAAELRERPEPRGRGDSGERREREEQRESGERQESPAAQPSPDAVEETMTYALAGPLCTSLDRLGEVALPELVPGDLLVFGSSGGYGFTEGMTHFLSHPVPPEIWVE